MKSVETSIELWNTFPHSMSVRFLTIIVAAILLPCAVWAQEQGISRRSGYLLIWQGISRPAYETSKTFTDMPDDAHGALEINYGKRRGILDDNAHFRPDDPLLLSDALLWIYRTRNVAELPDMQARDLSRMIGEYPIVEMGRSLEELTTQKELLSLVAKLDQLLRDEVHEVSYYADDFHGRGTAFGETFDMHALTAAHRSLPQDTLVRVRNVDNGKSIVVRINDGGPYIEGRNMDLSLAAFEKIENRSRGLLRATFERLGDKDLVDQCQKKRRKYQKRITRDVRFHRGVPHNFTTGEELVLQANRPFVVLGVDYPDGTSKRIQDFVHPKEKFRFTPALDGLYTFRVGNAKGRVREMQMLVESCSQ